MNGPPPELHAEARFSALVGLLPQRSDTDRDYVRRATARGWRTFQHLPPGAGSEKLLDVGSASGIFGPAYLEIWQYGEVHLIGYDVPQGGTVTRTTPEGKTLSFPTARCNIELERWPFPDALFDTVVCTEVLEHMIFDPVFVMNEMNRVLLPGGIALITVPNAASDTCLTYLANDMQPGFLRQYISDALASGERTLNTVYNLGHFHEYTRPEIECLAAATGFEVRRLTGLNIDAPLLDSARFNLLRQFVRLLFPRSRRVREDHILALLRKLHYTPLEQLANRYPYPLYRPLNPASWQR